MKALTLFIILFAASQNIYAKQRSRVHLVTGAFHHNSTDRLIYKTTEFPVERKYNSRSLEAGLFGFGWCSNLEYKVKVVSEETVYLTQCDNNKKFQLRQNSHSFLSRQTHAVYFNPTHIGLTLEWVKDRFLFKPYQSDIVYEFSPKGHLLKITYKKKSFRLLYGIRSKVRRLCYEKTDECMVFSYDQDQLVSNISSPSFDIYYFTKQLNLEKVATGETQKIYGYDNFNNLTRVTKRNSPKETLKLVQVEYDQKLDSVKRIERKAACPMTYRYSDNQAGIYSVEETQACKNQVQSKVYDFPYVFRNNKKVLLPTRSRYDLSQI